MAVTRPKSLTDATLVSSDDHVTLLSVASLGYTVAVNCFVTPIPIVSDEVLRDILLTYFFITVTEQVAFTPLPSLALQVIVAVPAALAVTRPELPTVATFVLSDDHVTLLSVASLGYTVADSCLVSPIYKVAVEVLRDMLVTGFFTVTEQVAFTPLPSLALQVIVAVPAALAVTRPELLTVATFVLLDDHVTLLSVALLGYTVAVSCFVFPTSIVSDEELSDIFVTLTPSGSLTTTV